MSQTVEQESLNPPLANRTALPKEKIRKEKSRVYAKTSRDKKKAYVESLERENEILTAEIGRLKSLEEENKVLRAEELKNKALREEELKNKVLSVETRRVEKENKELKEKIKELKEKIKELKEKIKEQEEKIKKQKKKIKKSKEKTKKQEKEIKKLEETIKFLNEEIECLKGLMCPGSIDWIYRMNEDPNDLTHHQNEVPEMSHRARYYGSIYISGSNSSSLEQQDKHDFSTFIEKEGEDISVREQSESINEWTFSTGEWM